MSLEECYDEAELISSVNYKPCYIIELSNEFKVVNNESFIKELFQKQDCIIKSIYIQGRKVY